MDLNNVSMTGRLTRDSQLKVTASGYTICEFCIANNGMKDTDTIFIDCTLWGKSAEALAQYLLKGQQVSVVGTLKCNKWVDRDDVKHEKWSINASQVALLGSKRSSNDEPPPADLEFNEKPKPSKADDGSSCSYDNVPF